MGKNKRKHPGIEETLARPWCYYCERDFDDLKILINHQKAKHYKCDRCGRRLNTAGGLSVHMTQVHKETLTVIENALPNRSGLEVEIFGMEGIPDEIVQSHNQRVLQQFAQAEAERRAATGNAGPDGVGGNATKKPKFESASDLKKRLAEHKAKKAAEEVASPGSGNNTPGGIGDSVQSPSSYGPPNSQSYQQHQSSPMAVPPSNPPYPPFPQPYGQQPPPSQQGPPFPHQQQPPPFQQQQPGYGPPAGMPQYHNNQPFAPPQQYQPPNGPGYGPPPYQNGPPPFQGGPPQFANAPPHHFQNAPPPFHHGPPQSYGPSSPPPFQHGQFQPPRNGTPPQHNGMPQRPPSLPPAPGLPQRPAFAAPPVNHQEMQQMHHGQFKTPSNVQEQAFAPQQTHGSSNTAAGLPGSTIPKLNSPIDAPAGLSANASSLDELVSGAAKDADKVALAKGSEQKSSEAQEEKKSRKEKDKNMKLVYPDNEVSPEEKMAQMPRYAFVRAG